MKISIIVAVDENILIGKRNSLPWYIPADLKHFKETTMGHHILFGQTTHESIGRPLPGRTNVVLSNDKNFKSEGCVIVHTPDDAVNFAKKAGESELFICGGAMIYKTFLPLADRIYMTKIHHEFDGDIYFPEIDLKKWKVISKELHDADVKNPYPYEFLLLEKYTSIRNVLKSH